MTIDASRDIPPSRRRWCAAAGTLLLAAVAGCASLAPRSVTFSESELAGLMAKHFPTTQRVAEIAEVTVSSPRVWLIPDRNRLGASFDVNAGDRLFRRSVQGKLALDCALRFEPSDDSIRLAQVRVQQLDLDTASFAGASLPVQRLGALVAERMLEDMPIYRLKPEQAQRLHSSGLKPAIAVTPQGVQLTLAER
jgi:hypothetical protein